MVRRSSWLADDVRREDEEEVRLLRAVFVRLPEEEAEHRDVAEDRDLRLAGA